MFDESRSECGLDAAILIWARWQVLEMGDAKSHSAQRMNRRDTSHRVGVSFLGTSTDFDWSNADGVGES